MSFAFRNGKVVASQEDNVDRTKLQTEVASLRDQISGIVSAAQFNGQNLLSNRATDTTYANIAANVTGTGQIDVLASLDRSATGSVASSNISVGKADLGTQANAAGSLTLAAAALTGAGAIANNATGTLTVVGETSTAGRTSLVMAGDGYQITGLTGVTGTIRYVARDGDTVNDIAKGLADMVNFQAAKSGISITASASGAGVAITNNSGAAITTAATLTGGGTAGGGLEILGQLDVSSADGASAALAAMEGLTQTSINAAATFGTGEKRLEIQQDFVSKLMDSMKAGIGALVDANMEEASARLQALQVQQQLGIQSLSIANQAPQNLLALFR